MSRTPWRSTTRRFAGVIALALMLPILPVGMHAAGARTPATDFRPTSMDPVATRRSRRVPATGPHKFKARLRNTPNNTHSLYSAAMVVTVS